MSSLIDEGLLDELHLFVNPTAIGAGMPVFPTRGTHRLRLVTARPFACCAAPRAGAPLITARGWR